MIVAVNHVADTDRREAIPEEWMVWSTDLPAAATYHGLAIHALAEGWDQSTIVVQDDIRFTSPPAVHDAELVVYGGYTGYHICPRAFAASPAVWFRLSAVFGLHPRRLCHTFSEEARRADALRLDQITHLEDSQTRPWPRRT